MANRRFRDPSIPHPTQANTLPVLVALKESVEIAQRLRGNEGDSFLRKSEFEAYTGGSTVIGLETHVTDTNNPHSVTAAQIGADSEGAAQNVQNNLDAHITDQEVHITGDPDIGDIAEWDGEAWVPSSRLTDLEAIVEILAAAAGLVFVEHNGETVTHNGEVVYYIGN